MGNLVDRHRIEDLVCPKCNTVQPIYGVNTFFLGAVSRWRYRATRCMTCITVGLYHLEHERGMKRVSSVIRLHRVLNSTQMIKEWEGGKLTLAGPLDIEEEESSDE